MIPNWLNSYLSENEKMTIEKAVLEAEKKTSGEIVPMIVRRSSTVGHVPLILYCLGIMLYYLLGIPAVLSDHFEQVWMFSMGWGVLFIPLCMLLSRSSKVQRLLVNLPDREQQAQQRALNEFYLSGLEKTDGSTGILLLVSVADHQAVVLADRGIASKLPTNTWDEVVDILISGIRSKNMADGFCEAIKKCGDILEPHFPMAPDDKNELPNHLVIKE